MRGEDTRRMQCSYNEVACGQAACQQNLPSHLSSSGAAYLPLPWNKERSPFL